MELLQTQSVIFSNAVVVPVNACLTRLLVLGNNQELLMDEDFNNKGSSAILALCSQTVCNYSVFYGFLRSSCEVIHTNISRSFCIAHLLP